MHSHGYFIYAINLSTLIENSWINIPISFALKIIHYIMKYLKTVMQSMLIRITTPHNTMSALYNLGKFLK